MDWPTHTWPGKRVTNAKRTQAGFTVYEMAREVDGRVLALYVRVGQHWTRQQTALELRKARRQLVAQVESARGR